MTQFAKGRSGNPKGRPRKAVPVAPSAFDIVFERTISVNHNGRSRDLTLEEGLQFKTYEAALAGNKSARRAILKMIAKRELWLAKRRVPNVKIAVRHENDPRTADKAMLLLGITARDETLGDAVSGERYLLEPWAVQAAVNRMRTPRLTAHERGECRRRTRAPDMVVWPAGFEI